MNPEEQQLHQQGEDDADDVQIVSPTGTPTTVAASMTATEPSTAASSKGRKGRRGTKGAEENTPKGAQYRKRGQPARRVANTPKTVVDQLSTEALAKRAG